MDITLPGLSGLQTPASPTKPLAPAKSATGSAPAMKLDSIERGASGGTTDYCAAVGSVAAHSGHAANARPVKLAANVR
jgi:hypothetical protein